MLAPARLSLPLDTVDEAAFDSDDQQPAQWRRHGDISLRHDYLHSLIVGEREDEALQRTLRQGSLPETKHKQSVFGVSLPETIAAPGVSLQGYKTLSEPFVEDEKRMAAAVVEAESAVVMEGGAPGSPPELSYSKSSKSSSSSLRSSLDGDDSTDKLSHFEDISIESGRNSIEDSNLRPESRPTLKRPAARSTTMLDTSRRASPPQGLGLKENNRYPSLKGAVNGVLRDQSLNLPYGRGMRRSVTSPSSPSLVHGMQRAPSRSPSPNKPFMRNGISISPQEIGTAASRLSADAASSARRKSWQPGQRKTAKEIEAEYDDGDEDVPDEAVLENVPISPLPGQSRPSRSTTPSPQRRPPQPLHTNLHSANVPKRAKRPSAPTVLPNGQYGSPRSPRHGRPPMLQHSMTMPAFPGEPLSRKHRSKSWTEDLNEEAKHLSAALEEYADRLSMEKNGSAPSSVTSSPPRPSMAKQRAKTSILELPQVHRGNIMIDPLPISKEKEAVLTRTRPSWLPPKSQKEEKRHMKEWEAMMARAAENEKKRALKERESMENKEEAKDSLARMWNEHVVPNWDTAVKEPRTRELWWRGVTPKSRGVVWQRAIGNELELSDASFDAALRRANEVEEHVAEMPYEESRNSKEAAWFDAITRDVPNACPELQGADKRAPFQNALRDVLKAYAMYRSDVGYVYGTHLVAGILCLHLRPVDAFVALANLLNRPLPLAFLVHDQSGMLRAYDLVLSTLKYKFTKLHDHLTSASTNLKPEEYLDPMFRCLFAYNICTEHVSRVWDIFVFEGDKALIRAAVAVLGRLEGKLYGSRDEILDVVSWRNEKRWDLGSEDEFMTAVRDAGKVDTKGETGAPEVVV